MRLIVPTTRILELHDPVWLHQAPTPFNVTVIARVLVDLGYGSPAQDQQTLEQVQVAELMGALIERLGASIGRHRLPFGDPDFQEASHGLWQTLLSYRPLILSSPLPVPNESIGFHKWHGKDMLLSSQAPGFIPGARYNPKWAQ